MAIPYEPTPQPDTTLADALGQQYDRITQFLSQNANPTPQPREIAAGILGGVYSGQPYYKTVSDMVASRQQSQMQNLDTQTSALNLLIKRNELLAQQGHPAAKALQDALGTIGFSGWTPQQQQALLQKIHQDPEQMNETNALDMVIRNSSGIDLAQAGHTKAPSLVKEYEYAVTHDGYTGSLLDFKLATKDLGPTIVTNVNAGNDKQADYLGEFYGKTFEGLMNADMAANKNIARYQQLGNLLSLTDTGKFGGNILEFKKALRAIGIEPEAYGLPDNIAPAEASRQISNQLALELRNPSGGAGMPGALSDADREFLLKTVPSLETTPGGNKIMVDYAIRMAQRDKEVARLARQYSAQHGGLIDQGFLDELSVWADAHPLFPEAGEAPPDWAQ